MSSFDNAHLDSNAARESDSAGTSSIPLGPSPEVPGPSQQGIHSGLGVGGVAVPISSYPQHIMPSHHASMQMPPAVQRADVLGMQPADCGCGGSCGGSPQGPQLVYALGQLGYTFTSEACRDRFIYDTQSPTVDPGTLLAYLDNTPEAAEEVIWLLQFDNTPIYAVHPGGAYGFRGYERLREFLSDTLQSREMLQRAPDDPQRLVRVAVPGYIAGSVRLMSGQSVPVIKPAVHGMVNWDVAGLITSVGGGDGGGGEEGGKGAPPPPPAGPGDVPVPDPGDLRRGLINFLNRVYYEFRNLGLRSQDRAMNFAGTELVEAADAIRDALRMGYQLDTIQVERSGFCRPDSDCWDVKLAFYYPTDPLRVSRKLYVYTIDVSCVIPVRVGYLKTFDIR